MKLTPLEEIRRAIHGRYRTAAREQVNIDSVSIDTRTARREDLFIAIAGENHDGHDYLAQAAQAGCVSAVVARDFDLPAEADQWFPGGVIGVADTTVALGELGSFVRGQLTGEVIGVTGSVGKTTVKRMIDHLLKTARTGSASPKSFNNAIGVPLTLLAADPAADYTICELGSNAPGEIASLARICRPTVAVITAIAPCHLERLGSLDRIAAEKAAILGGLSSTGVGVVNADSDKLARAVKPYEARLIRFGESEQAELRLTDYHPDGLGQRFEINGRLMVDLPVAGKHNAMNALAALAVALRLGLAEAEAVAALADFTPTPMRLEPKQMGPWLVINDAYNANPASMAAALEVLQHAPGDRRVLVVGDMLELGEQSEALHRSVGERIAQTDVGLLVAVGPMGRWIADEAERASGRTLAVLHYDDSVAASAGVIEHLRPGDVVLLKGSRGVRLERVVEALAAAAGEVGA